MKTRKGGSEKIPLIQGKEQWLCSRNRAWRSYPTLNVRNGGGKEIPLIQGKEQLLCFAGAAMKRYPTPK